VAAHWDIADSTLQEKLQAYIDKLVADGLDWSCHLFQNDYTPIPGSDISNYTECTFPGYSSAVIPVADWGTVTVSAHVASSTLSSELEFTADSSGFSSQSVYGYYVLDSADVYKYGERFSDTRTIHPDDVLKVTPIQREATYPNP